MIDNKQYVCYFSITYEGMTIDRSIAYFTNKEDMKKWMRKTKTIAPFGNHIFYIYLEGESKIYEKYKLVNDRLLKISKKTPFDKKRPNFMERF